MFKNSPQLSKLMAISLLIVVISGLWLVAISPLLDLRADYREDIIRSKRLISEFEARRHDMAALRGRQQRLDSRAGTGNTFWNEGNPTLAAAKMQSRLKSLTTAAGARLISTQIVTGEQPREEFARVTIRGNMVATIDALLQIFHAIEAGKPTLFLDNVTIASRFTGRAKTARSAGALLTIRFDAYGYLWQARVPS